MRIAPVNSEYLSRKRAVVASFVAGVGAMLVIGIVPVVAKGGLSMASAEASSLNQRAPVIQPLDVAAIQATLAEAEHTMAVNRAATDSAMIRLERLAGR